jgi:hypothetical protein
VEYLKVDGRKINADISSATGRKPNIVSVNGKPLNVDENDGMENSEIASSKLSTKWRSLKKHPTTIR